MDTNLDTVTELEDLLIRFQAIVDLAPESEVMFKTSWAVSRKNCSRSQRTQPQAKRQR
ncbi:hypothetical protein [Aliagarivorans taiwanensis]|uniref:hypothetical protein n=1 Tax=Aliagarivorans taiwanensis TaxID=561966 RepID=UPI0012F849F4|nr:hypothetical protein [Aliagarivorans taiwanensis]